MKKHPIFKNKTVAEIFEAFFVVFCSLIIFYLDTFVGGKISYYIFYFPCIAAMAWYFGRIAGWATVFLCAVLWFVKQWDLKFEETQVLVFWNGLICLASFCTICWMTLEIQEGQRKLKKRSQELEEFAFKAAHELKSPIMNISGYAELFDEQLPADGDPKTKDFVKNIFKNAHRMMGIIKELLDYARVGKQAGSATPLDLGKSLKETLEVLSPVIHEKKAEVLIDPLPTVAIQPGLAQILFQNLIGNALKYCEEQPRIRVSAARRGKDWLFSVRDNGIGIPEESRERVFIMFEKLVTRQQYPGAGIGLATCQKIVECCGGRIWVESPSKDGSVQGRVAENPGKGSTFFFTLPAVRSSHS